MTQLTIVTTPTNSGDGTPLATAFNYCNSNFNELYARVQTEPPTSLVGAVGDTAGMYAYDSSFFYYCFANYDGSSIIWGEIAQVGNISVSTIARGNSNVTITDLGGNVTTSVGGVANVNSKSGYLESIKPNEQRLAIAQIVLTLTSQPGIGQVTFSVVGKPIGVPRGRGDIAGAGIPVTFDDYKMLISK
jgi:hypothetical protein